MGYDERRHLITEIQKLRGTRVITLVTSEGRIASTEIADDCLESLHEHLVDLRSDESKCRIDVFLATLGGSVKTAWQLVNKIRQFCDEFSVIIPYRAYSAGTMICMGADRIVMSPLSDLGPTGPWLQIQSQGAGEFLIPYLGVGNMAAYITFLQQRAGITDQNVLAEAVKALSEHLTPTLVGRMERTHSHIRSVAHKLLALARPPIPESTVTRIVEALTQKMFAHGHGIGLAEAKSIGLYAENMGRDLERLAWELYFDYEDELKSIEHLDPHAYFADGESNLFIDDHAIVVFMESEAHTHVFRGKIRMVSEPIQITG